MENEILFSFERRGTREGATRSCPPWSVWRCQGLEAGFLRSRT